MGVPVVSILEDDDLWVSLNVGENQYASVYKNKTLEGFIPALNQTVMFKVKNIDAEGEFATIKPHVRLVVMTFVVLNYIWCLSVLSKT
jgi:HlyD family secretion protein